MNSKRANILGVVTLIVMVIALGVLIFLFYDFYTGQENVAFRVSVQEEDVNAPIFNESVVDEYPGGMLFYSSMRFKSKEISYSIDSSCPEKRSGDARRGFEILSEESVLSFSEMDAGGQILVSCSENISYVDDEHFIAGEGGPNSVINMTNRILIQNGTVLLYEDNECSKPIVAIHEILHVIGFQHSSNEKSIMYNFFDCNQKITSNIIDKIKEMYKEPTLPDLAFKNVSAVKHGRYLDMDFLVTNQGLEKSDATNVSVKYSGDKIATSYDIDELEVGEGRIISFKNVVIGYSTKEIELIVDNLNEISEIDEENNIAVLTLSE